MIWTLGGRNSDFAYVDEDGNTHNNRTHHHAFGFQHDARISDDLSQVTMFDNHALNTTAGECVPGEDCSRGLKLELHYGDSEFWSFLPPSIPHKKEKQLIRLFFFPSVTYRILTTSPHPASLQSSMQGNRRTLPPSHPSDQETVLVGWGASPAITEHIYSTSNSSTDSASGPDDGQVAMDIQFGRVGFGPDFYRAQKVPAGGWVGRPRGWGPAVAVVAADADADAAAGGEDGEGEGLTVYVSWNGATEVRGWEIVSRRSSVHLFIVHLANSLPQMGAESVDAFDGDDDYDGGGATGTCSYRRRVEKDGFETGIPLRGPGGGEVRFVRVEAIGADGEVLGTSEVVEARAGEVSYG